MVLFKWLPDASPEAIASVIEGLKGLKAKIPEIIDLSCGENIPYQNSSELAQGFQLGLVVRFADWKAREAYEVHPAHQEVVKNQIDPIKKDVIVVDYEI